MLTRLIGLMSTSDPERVRFLRTQAVLGGVAKAGSPAASPSRRALAQHFTTKGVGAGVRVPTTPSHARRVAVVFRKIEHGANASSALKAHVRYILRDGASQDEQRADLFDMTRDQVPSLPFCEAATSSDRRHYRVTVNPEDGRDLPDLRRFCRDLMGSMERDLGTRLQWVAGIHRDTGRPHLHIVLRGVTDDGRSLRLSHDYISQEARRRAEELVGDLLGPRPERAQPHVIRRHRYTALDRLLIDHARDGRLDLQTIPELTRSDALRRLTHLEASGFATRDGARHWRLPADLKRQLYALQVSAEREKVAVKLLAASGLKRSPSELVSLEPEEATNLVARFYGCRFSGAFAGGAHVVLLCLNDGRMAHVRVPDRQTALVLDRIPAGALIELRGLHRRARASDSTISEVAALNGGLWSKALHRIARPDDHPGFIERLANRLKALARENTCNRLDDQTYAVPRGLEHLGLSHDIARWGPAVPSLRVLDHRSLEDQVTARGATWLDRQLNKGVAASFGPAIDKALSARMVALRARNLMPLDDKILSPDALRSLLTVDIRGLLEKLQAGGRTAYLAKPDDRVSGVYRERVFLNGHPLALIETVSSVIAVPWHAGIESARNQSVVGQVKDHTFEFRRVRAPIRER